MRKKNQIRAAAINLRTLPEQSVQIEHADNLLEKNRTDIFQEAARDRAYSPGNKGLIKRRKSSIKSSSYWMRVNF